MLPAASPAPLVREALERAVELGERGLQVCAYLGDECIVDAWSGEGVDGDTVFPVFSVSKAVTALAVHVQAERGLVEYDAPLARYWPEYAVHGKQHVTVGQVLSHRAGVPQLPWDLTPARLGDWNWIVAELADMEPLYAPGTRNAYHSSAFGWLLGEIVRRTDPQARPFAQFVAEELCRPLAIDAFWFGIPAEIEPRVATLTFPDRPEPAQPGAPVNLAVPPAVRHVPEVFNLPEVHRAVAPAVGGIGNARSVARFFALLANRGRLDSVRLLSEERVLSFLEPRPDFDADDATYGRKMPVGIGGLWVEAPGVTVDGGLGRVLCHTGAGGSIAWAELDTGLAVAICHDRMFDAPDEHPFAALADAVRDQAASRSQALAAP
jgi:CubicO group peptidase (beta-lactamase class C family)